jgi:translation initiation factor eIF-2B subunit beta
MISEIEASEEEISKQAIDHIQDNDHILTFGFSNSVLHFFDEAAKNGTLFEVLVSE